MTNLFYLKNLHQLIGRFIYLGYLWKSPEFVF